MFRVIPLPSLGWRPELAAQLPAGTAPARVARVDRSRLAVLTEEGEQRVHLGAGLYADPALGGPAVGDWVALRDELAVALLPRRSAFTRTVAGRTSAAQVVAANLDVVLVWTRWPGRPGCAGWSGTWRWRGAAARRRSSS
jgi:hypothetical protein